MGVDQGTSWLNPSQDPCLLERAGYFGKWVISMVIPPFTMVISLPRGCFFPGLITRRFSSKASLSKDGRRVDFRRSRRSPKAKSSSRAVSKWLAGAWDVGQKILPGQPVGGFLCINPHLEMPRNIRGSAQVMIQQCPKPTSTLGSTLGFTVDGRNPKHHFETMGNPNVYFFYKEIVISGFLRWCEMDFVHPAGEWKQGHTPAVP